MKLNKDYLKVMRQSRFYDMQEKRIIKAYRDNLKQELILKAIMIFTMFIFLFLFISKSNASEIAIRTVAYESSGEIFSGQVAVAGVIKQRAKERHLTPEQVVLQRKQFSCWKNGKPTQKRKLKSKELEIAKKAWNKAKAEGYNHYHSKNILPYWAKGKKGVLIGSHIFYKL